MTHELSFTDCRGGQPRLHQPEDLPYEADQFTRHGHLRFVALLAARQQLPQSLVQACLRFPRALFYISLKPS